MNLIKGALHYLNSGNGRTVRAKKAITRMFLNKGTSLFLSMLYVPLFLECLDKTRYGIWVTIMSLVNWIGFFDIGIGQGLRNLLAKSLAEENYIEAKKVVSTAYVAMILIFAFIMVIFVFIYPFINWYKIFNAPVDMASEINTLILIVVLMMCMNFILGIFKSVLLAYQMPDVTSNMNLAIQSISLLTIFIFYLSGKISSLIGIGSILVIIPVLVYVFYTFKYFRGRFKRVLPSLRFFEKKMVRQILTLGAAFFIIQISNLFLFQSNNIIISNIIGPEAVPEYYIVNKYLSILLFAFTIITTPFWSAVTDAYTKKDIAWIKNVKSKLVRIYCGFVLLAIVMIIISPLFFNIWLGDKMEISTYLVILLSVFLLLQMYSNIFLSIINGIGKIKLQFYISILLPFIYVPLAIVMGKSVGIYGVVISGIIMMLIYAIIYPIQYYKIISNENKSNSIWYK
ncbi:MULTISPECIES: lipopolysaccharide biosynthesis protein [Bacteroides]|uniref:lipopolysaccharide biosynthesis protein n=3 Tax=Bacteroides TaxID=816 RepID=UPI0023F78C1C|nr:oligosaccharide flippase family protein [Bacteroides congonensis]